MIEWYEIQEQWPTLAAMAIIEVLLSVDNMMAVSAIARVPVHPPPGGNFDLCADRSD